MPRPLSSIAPAWWDYTTLEASLIQDAAGLTERDLEQLARPGFKVVFYDTLEDFYLAEALEYIHAWRQATADHPVGICGPIGPTEQLPLVARLVNELGVSLRHAHFWGMDEWYDPPEKRCRRPIRYPSNGRTVRCCLTASGRSCGCRRRICIFPRRIRQVTGHPGRPGCVAR